MRKRLSTFLKIAITVAGLTIVFREIKPGDIAEVLVDIRWPWFFLALLLTTASLALRAYRWSLLLRGLGSQMPFKRLVELYFIGNFFNAFLPSGFGGDAVRILEVARDVPANVAAGTVIVDRLTGLLMLFVMALVALPFRPAGFPSDWAAIIAVVSVVGLVGGFVLLDGRLIRLFGRWLPKQLAVISPVGTGPVAKLLQAVQGCGWPAIWRALAVSVLFNLILVTWWAAAGLALGFQINYTYYLLVVPILSVALLVPSISGLGVREYLAQLLFAGAGLDAASAVTLSLLVFVIMRLASLFGAPVYIASALRQQKKS